MARPKGIDIAGEYPAKDGELHEGANAEQRQDFHGQPALVQHAQISRGWNGKPTAPLDCPRPGSVPVAGSQVKLRCPLDDRQAPATWLKLLRHIRRACQERRAGPLGTPWSSGVLPGRSGEAARTQDKEPGRSPSRIWQSRPSTGATSPVWRASTFVNWCPICVATGICAVVVIEVRYTVFCMSRDGSLGR